MMGYFPSPPSDLDAVIKGHDFYIYDANDLVAWVKENHLKPDHFWNLKKYDIIDTDGAVAPPYDDAVDDTGYNTSPVHMDIINYTAGTAPVFEDGMFFSSGAVNPGEVEGIEAGSSLGGVYDDPSTGDFSIYIKLQTPNTGLGDIAVMDNAYNGALVTDSTGFRIYIGTAGQIIHFLVYDGTTEYDFQYNYMAPGIDKEFIMVWDSTETTIRLYERMSMGHRVVDNIISNPVSRANSPDNFSVSTSPAGYNTFEGIIYKYGTWDRQLTDYEIDWILSDQSMGLNYDSDMYTMRNYPAQARFSNHWKFQKGFFVGTDGNFIFDHGRKRTYTLGGFTSIDPSVTYSSTEAPPLLDGSLNFDGTVNSWIDTGINDDFYLGYDNILEMDNVPWAVSCWIYPDDNGGTITTGSYAIWGKYDNVAPVGVYVDYSYDNNEVELNYTDSTPTSNTLNTGVGSVPVNQWSHLLIVRYKDRTGGGQPPITKIFVNGDLSVFDENTASVGNISNNSNFQIANHQATSDTFFGYMTDFRVMCDTSNINVFASSADALYNNGNGLDY